MVYGRKLIDSVPPPLIFNQHNAQNPPGQTHSKIGGAGEPKSFGNRHELSFELCQNRSSQSRLAEYFTANSLPQIRMRLP